MSRMDVWIKSDIWGKIARTFVGRCGQKGQNRVRFLQTLPVFLTARHYKVVFN